MILGFEEKISNPKETAPNVKNFTLENHVKKEPKGVTHVGWETTSHETARKDLGVSDAIRLAISLGNAYKEEKLIHLEQIEEVENRSRVVCSV